MDNFPDQCDLICTLMDNVSPSLDSRSVVILIVPWEVVVKKACCAAFFHPKRHNFPCLCVNELINSIPAVKIQLHTQKKKYQICAQVRLID